MREPDRTIHNERTKLTATFLNGVAIAVLAVASMIAALGSSASLSAGTVTLNGVCFHRCAKPTCRRTARPWKVAVMTLGELIVTLLFGPIGP